MIYIKVNTSNLHNAKVGVKIWNSIPVKIRSSTSRASFRAEMKKYYISLYT